jgi:hypothetical protein
MGELIVTFVVIPAAVIGTVLVAVAWRERGRTLAALARSLEHARLIAAHAWNAALLANGRLANLEDRVRNLERVAHDHGRERQP